MKKATRILALVLALLMIACLGLTGCKKDEGGKGDEGNKTEVNKDEWKELTLEYWCLGPGAQELDAEVEAAANEILAKDLPNTKVHWTWIPGAEIKDKVTRGLAAEEAIDIVWLGWHWSKDEKYEMARDEVLLPIDEKLGADYLAYIGDMEREAISVDGKDYFYIGWQGLAYGRHGFWFSKKLVQEAGIEDTDAWIKGIEDLAYASYKNRTVESETALVDYFEDYAKGLEATGYYKDDAGAMNSIDCNIPSKVNSFRGGYGYTSVGVSAANASSFFRFPVGTDVTKDDFVLDIAVEDPISKLYYQKAAEYYQKGWIRSDIALTLNDSGATKSKYHKDNLEGGVKNPEYYKDYKFNTHNMQTKTREEHQEREGAKAGGIDVIAAYVKPTYYLDAGWSTMSAVAYPALNKEGAVERSMYYMNYLFTEEGIDYYRTIVYGREGQEWEWNADKETVTWHMGIGSQGDSNWKYGKYSWAFGTTLNALDTGAGGLPMSFYQHLKDMEAEMWSDPFANFSAKLNAEYTALSSNLGAIVKEYGPMLGNGYAGPKWEEKYNEYVKKLKDNGIEKLRDEVQRQLVEFAKENNITTGWDKNY